jgi:hypothetical protein
VSALSSSASQADDSQQQTQTCQELIGKVRLDADA